MTLEELELEPTPSTYEETCTPKHHQVSPQVVGVNVALPSHVFLVVGEDGVARKMTFTDDGVIIPYDDYLFYGD